MTTIALVGPWVCFSQDRHSLSVMTAGGSSRCFGWRAGQAGRGVPMSDQLDRDAAGALVVGFTGTTAPDELRRAVAAGLGAVILFTRNVTDAEQVAALTAALRAERPDLLIGIDHEGGEFSHLAPANPWPRRWPRSGRSRRQDAASSRSDTPYFHDFPPEHAGTTGLVPACPSGMCDGPRHVETGCGRRHHGVQQCAEGGGVTPVDRKRVFPRRLGR
jgi:hypothetical protein